MFDIYAYPSVLNMHYYPPVNSHNPPSSADISETCRQYEEAPRSMEVFLADVESRAYRMAKLSTGDAEAALDLVQEAMFRLVKHYADKPPEQWRPLFFKVLGNTIKDWHRSQRSYWRVFERWFVAKPLASEEAPEQPDLSDVAVAHHGWQPEVQTVDEQSMAVLEEAISDLPLRQQQAFMLRCWEGASTEETALIMGCTQGTVKTLYSRALATLRERLSTQLEHGWKDWKGKS